MLDTFIYYVLYIAICLSNTEYNRQMNRESKAKIMSFLLLFLLILTDIFDTQKPKIDLLYGLCYLPSLLNSPEPRFSRLSSTDSLVFGSAPYCIL